MLADADVVFATLADATLSHSLEEIPFHTWGDTSCCLPAGATAATLRGHLDALSTGDVLLFEEVLGPLTGAPEDADRRHRWVVRLTHVHHTDRNGLALVDPVSGERVTEIAWATADALPFPLCLSVGDMSRVSVARGNMVPADHGLWHDWASLGTVPAPLPVPIGGAGGDCCGVIEATAPPPFFFPALPASPLTFARDFDPALPASALVAPLPPDAPVVQLPKPQLAVMDDRDGVWSAERDLLSLDALQQGFVIETERDGTAFLRFGDDEYGAAPEQGDAFSARFRTGTGSVGNVGPDTLGHVLTSELLVRTVRNPLAGAGGRDPDTMEVIRQRAPWAFRTQLRAVTESDYGDVAARDPAIREARGTLRWTGSWRTAFVAIDPAPGTETAADLARATVRRLDMLRMAGVDLAVEPAVIVGLRVALAVCVRPRYRRTDVARALSQVLIAGDVCDGTPGLLAPSRFSFGQTVYLSPIIAAAQAVEGVASVHATAFQRVSDPARDAVSDGFIIMQRLEIARVDNDPSRPDHGILELALDGGE